jgi:hypothetical protein
LNASRVALFVALPVSGVCAVVFGVLASAGGTVLGSGAVTVRSEPTEAGVFVDGLFRGVTPLEITGLPGGRHSVRIEKGGFKVLFAALETPPRGVTSFRLEPVDTGLVDVRTEPAGAEVYLDGRFRGLAPLSVENVRAGPHVIRAEKTGRDPATVSALVSAGTREIVHLELADRVLRYLEYAAKENPDHMLTHMELGHYYMVIGDALKAAHIYSRAKILSCRPETKSNDRRKLEMTIKRDKVGKLGAKLSAEIDRLLREHDTGDRR